MENRETTILHKPYDLYPRLGPASRKVFVCRHLTDRQKNYFFLCVSAVKVKNFLLGSINLLGGINGSYL